MTDVIALMATSVSLATVRCVRRRPAEMMQHVSAPMADLNVDALMAMRANTARSPALA